MVILLELTTFKQFYNGITYVSQHKTLHSLLNWHHSMVKKNIYRVAAIITSKGMAKHGEKTQNFSNTVYKQNNTLSQNYIPNWFEVWNIDSSWNLDTQ